MVGWRQRSAPARSRSPRKPCAQLNHWLQSWAWGDIPATEVIRNARAFAKDGFEDEAVSRLNRASGAHDVMNAERALYRVLPENLIQITSVPNSSVEVVILPKDTLNWIQTTSPRLFEHRLGAGQHVEQWWQDLYDQPESRDFWDGHPFLQGRAPAQLANHLPVMVHDDAGPVSQHQSAYVRNWFSLLGKGRETETRFLLSTRMKKQSELPGRSWPIILQNFEELAQPAPAGRWGAILLFVSGDLDYLCNDVGLRHFNGCSCCFFCEATTTEAFPHNQYQGAAAWRETVFDNAAFLGALRRPLHPLAEHAFFQSTLAALTCSICWTIMVSQGMPLAIRAYRCSADPQRSCRAPRSTRGCAS